RRLHATEVGSCRAAFDRRSTQSPTGDRLNACACTTLMSKCPCISHSGPGLPEQEDWPRDRRTPLSHCLRARRRAAWLHRRDRTGLPRAYYPTLGRPRRVPCTSLTDPARAGRPDQLRLMPAGPQATITDQERNATPEVTD